MAKMKRKPWFRMWDEILTDPKMRNLTDAQWGIWLKLLCLANQQSERGLIVITHAKKSPKSCLASLVDTKLIHFEVALETFSVQNMVEYDLDKSDGYLRITNWHKRQFASDDTTARTLKHYHTERSTERLIEHPRTEQNREEQPTKVVSSHAKSFLNNNGELAEETPLEVPSLPCSLNNEKNTPKEKIKPTYELTTEDRLRFTKRNGTDQLEELLLYVEKYLTGNNGDQAKGCLWHTIMFYDYKEGPNSAKIYFKKELDKTIGAII